MKKLLPIMLVLFFVLPLFAENPIWFKGSFDEALKKAEKEGKPILLDFYSGG